MDLPRSTPALVPSLRRLAAQAAPRRGFTLVEVLVAIAISSVIVLMAVSTFRMISKVLQTSNALMGENALLRTGMQLALQDVDYWHSHANEREPYDKGWTRVRAAPDDPATGFIAEDKVRRPFQPIRFSPRTDTAERDPFPGQHGTPLDYSYFNAAAPTLPNGTVVWHSSDDFWEDPYQRNDVVPNPNAMLAHDPRSVSRQTLRPLRVPERDAWDWEACWQWGYPRLAIGDYTLVSATDAREPAGTLNPRWPTGTGVTIPLDLTFTGAQTDAYPDSGSVDIPVDPGLALHQPLLWASMYWRGLYLGLYGYMTPGTPIVFHDSRGNTCDWFTVPLSPYIQRQYQSWDYAYIWDRDWQINHWTAGGGNIDVAVRMGDTYSPTIGLWGAPRITAGIAFRPTWPRTSLAPDNADANWFAKPFNVFFGNSGYWGGTEGMATGLSPWGNLQASERGDQTRNDFINVATTMWLPYNRTDAERSDPDTGTAINPGSDARTTLGSLDFRSKPADMPALTTSLFRYMRVAGAQDLTVARIAIDSPAGHRIEMTLTPFSTTYRGARQHWRLYSKGIGGIETPPMPGHRFALPDKACIGDFYDEADGPYYVP